MILPCGCDMDIVNGMFIIKPCSLDCKYYLYALEETRRQGKPVIKFKVS